MTPFGSRVRRAGGFAALGHVGRHVLHLVTWFLLARWLAPAVLGRFGLVLVAVGVTAAFADVGFGAALVQREQLDEDAWHTGFWCALAAGGLAAAAVAGAALPYARFFGEPGIAPALRIASLAFVLQGLAQMPAARLTRELRFGPIAGAEIVSSAIACGAALGLVAEGAGLLGLVVARLLGDAVSLAVLFAAAPHRPRARFSRRAFTSLFGFGGTVFSIRALNQIASRLDSALVGKTAGAAALGLYGLATQVLRVPEQQVSQLVKRVAFPAFSRLQQDRAAFGRAYARLVGSVARLTFPASAGIFVVFPDLAASCLGPAWQPTVPLVRALCLAGALFSVGGTIGIASWSIGRPGVELALAVLRLVLFGALVWLGARFGALGVAAATSVYAAITFPVYLLAVRALTGLSVRALLAELWPAVQGSAAMAVAVVGLRAALRQAGTPAAAALVVCALAGAAVYLAILAARRDPRLRELVGALTARRALAPVGDA